MTNNFCGKCGARLDAATGLCPTCDKVQISNGTSENRSASSFCYLCGSKTDAQTGMCTNPDCTQSQKNANVTGASQSEVKKKPKKSKTTAPNIAITILLSICFFITSVLAIVIFEVRNIVKEDNAAGLLDHIQATQLLDDTAASNLQPFYDYMEKEFSVEIENQQLDKFVNRSLIKNFMAKKIAAFCEDLFEGEAELKITKDEVITLLQKNTDNIEKDFGKYLLYSDISKISDWIFDDNDEIIMVQSEVLKDSVPILYYFITIGFSYITMIGFILLSVLILIFMIRNSLSQTACGIGIDFIIFGGLTGLAAAFAAWITPLWEAICGNSVVGTVIGNFLTANAVVSIVLFLLGIVLLVSRCLAVKHYMKKAK